MQLIKLIGLAFLASLAFAIVTTASATARGLGILECVNVGPNNGGFNDAACLVEGGSHEYKENEVVGETFTSKASSTTVLATSGRKIECLGAMNEGEVTSRTEDEATVRFTGCKEAASGVECKSAGASAKEIETAVSSKIVSLGSGTSLVAGLLLSPHNAGGENVMEFECVGTQIKVYGSVIGSIGPESLMSLSFTATLAVDSTTKEQEIEETTNSLRAKFAGGSTEKATLASVVLLDFPLRVEIMG